MQLFGCKKLDINAMFCSYSNLTELYIASISSFILDSGMINLVYHVGFNIYIK